MASGIPITNPPLTSQLRILVLRYSKLQSHPDLHTYGVRVEVHRESPKETSMTAIIKPLRAVKLLHSWTVIQNLRARTEFRCVSLLMLLTVCHVCRRRIRTRCRSISGRCLHIQSVSCLTLAQRAKCIHNARKVNLERNTLESCANPRKFFE
jgi:hypothetical protein